MATNAQEATSQGRAQPRWFFHNGAFADNSQTPPRETRFVGNG